MASPSLNTVLSTIKACVISNPDGVDENSLNYEYRQLMGCSIPWREHGFKNLQDLIKSSPGLQTVSRGDRRLVVAETASIGHLSAMIKTQKKTSKKRAKVPRMSMFFPRQTYIKPVTMKTGAPSFFSGKHNYNGYNKPVTKKVGFVDKYSPKPNTGSNEVVHHANARPAGESSSSSGNSTPTYEQKSISKQPVTNKKSQIIDNKDIASKTSSQSVIKEKTGKKSEKSDSIPQKSVSKKNPSVKQSSSKTKSSDPLSNKSTPSTDSLSPANSSKPPKSKSPLLPTPLISNNSVAPVKEAKPDKYKSPLLPTPQSILPNNIIHSSKTVPVQLFTNNNNLIQYPLSMPISTNFYQQCDYIGGATLVPPKPMKPGSYRGRGGRRKNTSSSRAKLCSILDVSTPMKDSNTYKFINLIKDQEWPLPEYRILPRTSANNVEVYDCTVSGSYSFDNNESLLTYSYSTIPDEFKDRNSSKEAVSKKAFEDMCNKIKEASHYIPFTSGVENCLLRIYEIVSEYKNGVWAFKVESEYKKKHGERLPKKWEEMIELTDCLAAEILADFSYVIRQVAELSGPILVEKEESFAELEYPETETWDVYVTKVFSSCEVYFRFVGPEYSDLFDELSEEMSNHYQDWSRFVCTSPVVGGYYCYAANYGPVRVKVISLDTPNLASVLNIDHGEVEEVPRDHLCTLDPKFFSLAPQAVSCRMYDLENYSDDKLCTSYLVDHVEGEILVAEIIQTEPLTLIMNDTSSDDPINLNQEINDSLKNDICSPPDILNILGAELGVVTSIWKTGQIYLQIPNDGLAYINKTLKNLPEVLNHYLTHPKNVLPDILYLVEIGGTWFRALILPPARLINNMVELLLIDTGDISTILYTYLVPLSSVSLVLLEIPRQAIQVKLSKVDIYEETFDRMMSLMPPPCQVMFKVVAFGQIPEVEVFVKNSKGLYISVNLSLQAEDMLRNNISSLSLRPYNLDFVTIKQAHIPDSGETNFIDIYVISVVSPSNFIIIPLVYLNKMSKLHKEMQMYYNNTNPEHNKLRSFKVGQVCAVQHSDDVWYRGVIDRIIDESANQLFIRFCDYGNCIMISSDKVLSLNGMFLNLPAVGINASIADIKPISGDWELSDCKKAQNLMLEKKLVAIIKNKSEVGDQIYLELQVFDTTYEDLDIGQVFVDELIAVYK